MKHQLLFGLQHQSLVFISVTNRAIMVVTSAQKIGKSRSGTELDKSRITKVEQCFKGPTITPGMFHFAKENDIHDSRFLLRI